MDHILNNMVGASSKSDLNTIDAPIFSLQKKIDNKQFKWEKDDLKLIVTPNRYGRATIWDKDIILYLIGQVAATINRKGEPSRTIRTVASEILLASKRGSGGDRYHRLNEAFRRLKNTTIETNMSVEGYIETKKFSLIQDWREVKNLETNKTIYLDVTLSEWLYKAALSLKLVTYDKEYFEITSGTERRLYEIFRKHLGRSSAWNIGEKKLFHKVGSRGNIRRFRYELKKLNGKIVGFRFYYDLKKKKIYVYPGSKKP